MANNQTVIETEDCNAFQSYDSLVAKYDRKTHELTLGKDWDYSKTTVRWLHVFFERYVQKYDGCSTATIRKFIEAGMIKYDPDMK